jgi:photosystem II stability/assembly factor-like uncharacterized protein
MRYFLFLLGALFLIPHGTYSQWKLTGANLLGNHDLDPYGGCLTHYSDILWAGYDDVFLSIDSGKTWQLRTPFKRSDKQRVVNISVYDKNTALVVTISGKIFITGDQGQSWKQVSTNFSLLYGATFLASPDQLACYTGDCDLYVTLNSGLTWNKKFHETYISHVITGNGGMVYVIGGNQAGSALYSSSDFGDQWNTNRATFDWDSWSIARDQCDTSTFYIANEEFIAPIDNLSSVFVTSNEGKSWTKNNSHGKVYHCGSVTTSNNSVFVQTFFGIDRSTDKGISWKTIGGPPNTYDTKTVTALSDNIIFAVDSFGNIWSTFNSGGDSLSTSSPGGSGTVTFTSSTIINDSIGVIVHLPIYLHRTGTISDVDMVVHYPAGPLQYLGGALVGGKSIDISGGSWAGRAELHFDASDLNALKDSLVGYVSFKWTPLEFDCATINFDSITSQTIDCTPQLANGQPFKGIIGAYKWCAESVITPSQSDLHFSIMPNPSRGIFTVSSNEYSGEATITITDELGKTVLTEKESLTISGVNIDASKLSEGNYFLTITTAKTSMTYPIKLLK